MKSSCLHVWAILALLPIAAMPARAQSRDDKLVTRFMQKHHVPGLAFVILRDGSVVNHGTYGVANTATKERITNTSVFPIASLSKPFVALGVLWLAERNRVDLNLPVGKYLPNLPATWKTIPLVRLLDHTSGVPDHYNAGKWNVLDPTPISSDELIEKLTTLPLEFQRGEKFQYSNGNYALLAKVIEMVSGEPYEEFLDRQVFKPLGMTHTRVLHQEDLTKIVHGYESTPDGMQDAPWNPDWCYGNGAIGATWPDLARLDAGLYTERIVKFSTLTFITSPQPLSDGSKPGYAMGWMIGKSRQADTISHSGRLDGWCSYFVRYPKYNLTVAILSNNGSANLNTLGADLAGTEVDDLALDPAPDQNPGLTQNHLKFVQAIMNGNLDEGWLNGPMKNDFESKDHWVSIGKDLTAGGEITLFEPVTRDQVNANEMRTRYRLEQGDRVRSVTIGCNPQGQVSYLYFTS